MTGSVRAGVLMHLTRVEGGGRWWHQTRNSIPTVESRAGQFGRQCLVLKFGSKNEGKEPGGRSFKTKPPWN